MFPGEASIEHVVRWDSVEWHRWILESKPVSASNWLLNSLSLNPDEFLGEMTLLQCTTEISLSEIASLPGTADVPCLVSEANSNLLSLVDRVEICWSNLFRYKESKYCSKYTTSNSNIPISLISSFAA